MHREKKQRKYVVIFHWEKGGFFAESLGSSLFFFLRKGRIKSCFFNFYKNMLE